MNEMEIEHFKEIYNYIFSLFEDDKTKGIVKQIFEQNKESFFSEPAAKIKHQNYSGGLADHTALATMIAYYLCKTQGYMNVRSDDAMISALFHDWEKIGNYNRQNYKMFRNDDDVIYFLRDRGLITERNKIANGIFHAHGGWSPRPGLHLPIAIIVHFSDMAASQITKERKSTRDFIKKIKEFIEEFEISKMIDKNGENDCRKSGLGNTTQN